MRYKVLTQRFCPADQHLSFHETAVWGRDENRSQCYYSVVDNHMGEAHDIWDAMPSHSFLNSGGVRMNEEENGLQGLFCDCEPEANNPKHSHCAHTLYNERNTPEVSPCMVYSIVHITQENVEHSFNSLRVIESQSCNLEVI